MREKKNRNILYLGKDDLIYRRLESYYKNLNQPQNDTRFHVFSEEFNPSSIDKLADHVSLHALPHLLILDLSDFSFKDPAPFLKHIGYVRKHPIGKSTPIVALLKDKWQVESYSVLLTVGVFYFFIKGDKEDFTPFRDFLYIAFEETVRFPRLAIAKIQQLETKIELMGQLHSLTPESICLETDLDLEEGDTIAISSSLPEPFNFREFSYSKKIEGASQSETFFRYIVDFPYPGPWEEITAQTLFKDTLESYIADNQKIYTRPPLALLLVAQEMKIHDSCLVWNYKREEPLNLLLIKDVNDRKNFLLGSKPSVVIFCIDSAPEKEEGSPEDSSCEVNTINTLAELIEETKRLEEYEPIVFLFNSPSSTSATRKVLGYEKIIAHKTDLSPELLTALLDPVLMKLETNLDDQTTLQINETVLERSIGIIYTVSITSITEHEITFLSSKEIPIYSVIKINTPIKFFATIVPSFKDIGEKAGLYHYMALIHSVLEDDLATLRRFVNFSIYNKITTFDFTQENLKSEIGDEAVLPREDQNVEEKEIYSRDVVMRTNSSKFRSKL